jgi:uncharacterized protein (DUF2336 family)
MVVPHFLRWIKTAKVAERSDAASALSRAYLQGELDFDERCAAEAALTLLLDDPSWKVRAAMAEALSLSRAAPAQIIAALASDQPEVAAVVLARSPLLSDGDLIDRVANGSGAIQALIADRPRVSVTVAAAIAEVGDAGSCTVLVRNSGADIAAISFRRLVERFGDRPAVREVLMHDRRLPAECRHQLLAKVGEALRAAPFVRALIGPERAERLTREACLKASLGLIDATRAEEHPAVVEHLRLRGDLSTAFMVRLVAAGKIDFFGSALIALSGQNEARVRSLLATGHDVALAALFRAAGLPVGVHGVLSCALKVWRDVANGRRVAGPQEVTWLMLDEIGGPVAESEVAGLLKSIHLDCLRENARGHALAIAAA